MSAPIKPSDQIVSDKRQLVEFLEAGCKPPADWRIGTEHEKFGYRLDDLSPLPYEGPSGIRAVLEGLQRFGWQPYYEGENVIALTSDSASVSLEPGGALELSGAPLNSVHETCDEVNTHLEQVREVAEELGVGFLGLGFRPKWRLDEIPMMPKGRYAIMKRYMPTKGKLGLEMMLRTSTVQVNLDFESEADMVEKFRIGLALQPVATALFANSPLTEGKPNGYLSYRSHIWTDTDPDRCGMLPWVFAEGMSFERYVDYALDVPMYFVQREGAYIDAAGQSFRDFLDATLPALPGEQPTLKDWEDHLTTLFPEVRLKRYLEMRGADGGPWRRLCALPALWTGLLYDAEARGQAWELVADWTDEEREGLRASVPRLGLNAPFRGAPLLAVVHRVLDIAKGGLERRARLDSFGEDEAHFLSALFTIAEAGKTPAEELLEAYEGRWGGDVDSVFAELAY